VGAVLGPEDTYAWGIKGEVCLYCGRETAPPLVVWHGSGRGDGVTLVVLHPGCVVELMIRMIRDVHEVEIRTHEGVTRDAHL
jgi:hypothetical protein